MYMAENYESGAQALSQVLRCALRKPLTEYVRLYVHKMTLHHISEDNTLYSQIIKPFKAWWLLRVSPNLTPRFVHMCFVWFSQYKL